MRNLEILNNTTDARGRKLEVVKVHCPPPLFRTYKEAAGVDVRTLPSPVPTPPLSSHTCVPNACFPACRCDGMPLAEQRHQCIESVRKNSILQAVHEWQCGGCHKSELQCCQSLTCRPCKLPELSACDVMHAAGAHCKGLLPAPARREDAGHVHQPLCS